MVENGVKNTVAAAFSGTGWMFAIAILKKLFTFTLNQLLIRCTTPEMIGTADIQLELLSATLLFMSRESIRHALLRVNGKDPAKFQQIVNFSWVSPAFIFSMCLLAVFFQGTWSNGVPPVVVQLYCFGAFFETLGEPFHNTNRNKLVLSPGINASAAAIMVRCVVTFLAVGICEYGIVGFGLAQAAYGLTDCLVMVYYTLSLEDALPITHYLPSYSSPTTGMAISKASTDLQNPLFDSDSLTLAGSTMLTTFLKHILTQADKIALTLTSSSVNQGIYALTHNYVSLVARIVYFPLEESSRLAFSRILCDLRSMMTSLDALEVQTGQQSKHATNRQCTQDTRASAVTAKATGGTIGGDDTNGDGSDAGDNDATRRPSGPHISGSRDRLVAAHVDDNDRDEGKEPTSKEGNTHDRRAITIPVLSEEQLITKIVATHTTCQTLFNGLVLAICLFGFIFALFGPFYSKAAVQLIFSPAYQSDETERTLMMFCVYILILGVNGITEAFLHAVAPPQVFLAQVNGVLVLGSVVFFVVVSLPVVRDMGTSRVVLGNICSMVVRIVYSLVYVQEFNRQPCSVFIRNEPPSNHSGKHLSVQDSTAVTDAIAQDKSTVECMNWRVKVATAVATERVNDAQHKTFDVTNVLLDGAFYVVVVMVLYHSSSQFAAGVGLAGGLDLGTAGSRFGAYQALLSHVLCGVVMGIAVLVHMWVRYSLLVIKAIKLTRQV